ncbi:D-alanyl-D-alanine carboxypeptidase [Candidatus Nomurabacteria bacterium]|nr:D-alanyl-D-alanine carboxypeptidase [Candidatus Nomurabacteria bacterium]
MPEQYNKNYLLFFILFVMVTMATFFFIGDNKQKENERLAEERLSKIQTTLNEVPFIAKAVSVYNITKNQKLYGKNDEVALPIASLAKIISVAVGLNNHKEEEIISISNNAVKQTGDFGIFANEKWRVGDLAKFTLLVSANDGAYALLEGDENFIKKMNDKAKRIGTQNTLFVNATGLDIDKHKIGASATAEDVNTMAVYAWKSHPEIFGATALPELTLTSESGFVHNFKNTNVIVKKIPNLLFSKTGFTDIAGGNLSIIFKDLKGDNLAITILGSTFEGRFEDMEKIVNVLYNF